MRAFFQGGVQVHDSSVVGSEGWQYRAVAMGEDVEVGQRHSNTTLGKHSET